LHERLSGLLKPPVLAVRTASAFLRSLHMQRLRTLGRWLGLPLLILAGAGTGLGAAAAWRALQDPARMDPALLSALVAESQSPLVLYTTSQCPYCRQARALLDHTRTPHAVREIDTSKLAREQFQRLGGQGVPLLISAERAVIGFDEAAYRELLDTVN
jgi:mycoredoxin